MSLRKMDSTLAKAKASRDQRRQLGQFMTPEPIAQSIVGQLELTETSRVLEPSFGDGSFLVPLVEALMAKHRGDQRVRFERVLAENLFGVEVDPEMYARAISRLEQQFGPMPSQHNLQLGDFFRAEYITQFFDFVVGNPPFGGTFDPLLEDGLDRQFGSWDGHKLKKETYSFFIARSLELVGLGGGIRFVSSDTFLTINTMRGLRRRLAAQCDSIRVETLSAFSAETTQPTVVLSADRGGPADAVTLDSRRIAIETVNSTPNFSWRIDETLARYFAGETIGDYLVATSGMTIGNNALFLREIKDGAITETVAYEFFEDRITLEREVERARLNKLSERKREEVLELERQGATRRHLRIVDLSEPQQISLPHPDYRFYNKAASAIVYSPPRWAVLWRDRGDAVLTFKRNGNWYLHGVGGAPFFEREGISWQLVAGQLNMRYLPEGYILDSGAPTAFTRPGVPRSELLFILGWALTPEASRILKTVLNHTRNIQSKDVERLPYPWWVPSPIKREAIELVERMVREGQEGRSWRRSDPELVKLADMFAIEDSHDEAAG